MRIGEQLKRDIGVDWLLSISLDPDFLRPLNLEAPRFWCMLWTDAGSSLGDEIYDAVLFRKITLEQAGNTPRAFGVNPSFSAADEPPECPGFEELPHVRAAMEQSASLKSKGEQEESKMGPGQVVVGGLAITLAIIGAYKWLTKPRD